MEDTFDDFSGLSLEEIAGNRVELLDRIQQQLQNVVDVLNAGSDFSLKESLGRVLQQVIKNLDFLKVSCNEEGNGNYFDNLKTDIPIYFLISLFVFR